jgi:glycosyltransferase involved in cell wall biosynthesis
MISVVTAYYNRKKLFKRTLKSMLPHYGIIDFEVIAVDDGSDEHERLEDLKGEFPFLSVIRLEKENKWYRNPCIPFNVGFENVKGDKVILQNPECYHFGAILPYIDKNLADNNYLSFGCYSLDKKHTDNEKLFFDKERIEETIKSNDYTVKIDGELGWYNHSVHRPVAFHFCAALTYKDLFDLGGFDPRYAMGVGFDDNEFVWRIRQKGMKISVIDQLVVLHQNHYTVLASQQETIEISKSKIYEHNSRILEKITVSNLSWRANYINNNNRPSNFENSAREDFIRNINVHVNTISNRKNLRRFFYYLVVLIIKSSNLNKVK